MRSKHLGILCGIHLRVSQSKKTAADDWMVSMPCGYRKQCSA